MKKNIFTLVILLFVCLTGFAQIKSSFTNLPTVFKMLQKPSYRQVMSKIQAAAEANLAENKLSVKEPKLIYINLWDSAGKNWRSDTLEKYVVTWDKNKNLLGLSDISWDSINNGAVINTIGSNFVKINAPINIDNNVTTDYFPGDVVIQILQNGKWVNYEKEVVSLDNNKRITTVIVQQWIQNAWVNYLKDEITYDGKGNFTGYSSYSVAGSKLTLLSGIRETLTINSGGAITSLLQSTSKGGAYVNSLLEQFSLDGKGAITNAVLSSFDSIKGQWYKTDSIASMTWLYFNPILSIDYQTLNTTGILGVGGDLYLGYINTKYDSSLKEWVSPQKNIFTYNADSLPTNVILQNKVKNAWVNNTSDSTSYYPRDDIKTYLPRYWASGWNNSSQGNNNINTYDAEDDIKECIAQNTDQNNPNAFDNYSKTEYLYNSDNGIEPVNNATFKIYPNPVSNMLNIELGQNESRCVLTITDLAGKTIQTKYLVNSNLNSIDITGLAPGMYFASVNNGNGVSTSKFIKE